MHVVGMVDDWEGAERYLIRRCRESGFDLLNVEDGGRGSYATGAHKPKSSTQSLFKVIAYRVGMRARLNREAGDSERSQRMLRLLDGVRRRRKELWRAGGDDAVELFDREMAEEIIPLVVNPGMIAKLVGES